MKANVRLRRRMPAILAVAVVALQRYRRLLSGAAANFTLSNKQPRSKREAGMAAGKRDRVLIAATHDALVVWDEQDRRLGEQIAVLEQRIADDVWVIPPTSISKSPRG